MLNHPWIALAYSVALLGIGYLASRLVRLRLKPPPIKSVDSIALKHSTKSRPQDRKAHRGELMAADKLADSINTLEVPIPGLELFYFKPFGPKNDIFDVWQNLQTFTSTEPITLRLMPSDDTTPILKSRFLPNGKPQSTKEIFFQELGNGIRDAGSSVFRSVRVLSSFGIPSLAPEAAYHVFTGSLSIELTGIQVMGLTFSVRAAFEPNLSTGWRSWRSDADRDHGNQEQLT